MSLLVLIKDHAYVRDVVFHDADTPMFNTEARELLEKALRESGVMRSNEHVKLVPLRKTTRRSDGGS